MAQEEARKDPGVLLGEVLIVLGPYAEMGCVPCALLNDRALTITLELTSAGPAQGLRLLELRHELQYVADVGQIRLFAMRYGIDPARLEALLPERSNE